MSSFNKNLLGTCFGSLYQQLFESVTQLCHIGNQTNRQSSPSGAQQLVLGLQQQQQQQQYQ
jgi:hypothetical protein